MGLSMPGRALNTRSAETRAECVVFLPQPIHRMAAARGEALLSLFCSSFRRWARHCCAFSQRESPKSFSLLLTTDFEGEYGQCESGKEH